MEPKTNKSRRHKFKKNKPNPSKSTPKTSCIQKPPESRIERMTEWNAEHKQFDRSSVEDKKNNTHYNADKATKIILRY